MLLPGGNHMGWRSLADAMVGRLSSGKVDRKSTRLNSSHLVISYAVFCLKKKKFNRLKREPACGRPTRYIVVAASLRPGHAVISYSSVVPLLKWLSIVNYDHCHNSLMFAL